MSFPPILFNETSQKDTLSGIEKLTRQFRDLPLSNRLQQGILQNLRTTSGDEQWAILWLSLQLLSDISEIQDTDQYLNLLIESVNDNLLEDVYSFALDILSIPSFDEEGPSPQAPLVLFMMFKLCISALIPYLDDLVESIFINLACYHGYPRLIESLLSVLQIITEESGKSPITAITSPSAPNTRQPTYKPTSMAQLTSRLKDLQNRTSPPSPSSSPSLPPSEPPPPPLDSDSENPLLPSIALLPIALEIQTTSTLPSPVS